MSTDEVQVHSGPAGGPRGPGTRSYRILEVIGKGGFGTVYRAELLGSGGFTKHVALKVLHNTGAPDEIVLRFRDEARILGLIQHRAIVKVDSLAHLDKGWAVVMEYVPGVNVSALVKYGPTPPRAALNIIEEVASALHAANALPSVNGEPLRLIHRDIKPGNIRVSPQGEVKVLDFGVARAEFGGREAQTEALRFGSARYMSPERADGIEGPFIDVYALGLILAELLAGQRYAEPPKNADRHAEWLAGVQGAIRARLATNPSIDAAKTDALATIVSRMLAYEVAGRPSARDVERDARQMAGDIGGSWLREWAESTVPVVESRLAKQTDTDPISGSILMEKAGALAMHALDTDTKNLVETPPGAVKRSSKAAADPTRAIAGVGLAVVLGVAVIVALGVGVVLAVSWNNKNGPTLITVPVGMRGPDGGAGAATDPAAGTGNAAAAGTGSADPAAGAALPADPGAATPDPAAVAATDPAAAAGPTPRDLTGNANAEARRREEQRRKAEEARLADEAAKKAREAEAARLAAEADKQAHTAVIAGIEFDTLTHGVVVVEGDMDKFVLVDAGGTAHEPGALTPGKYESRVTFNGQDVPGPLIPVTAGVAVKVRCTAAMMVCSRQ